jgi:hypothetical protein
MKNHFPYPIPAEALQEFCHPAEWHAFHLARRFDREILAGNGYLAIRCQRGRWIDSEFPAASAEFLSRWGKLPWSRWEVLAQGDHWRRLEDASGRIFAKSAIGFWLGTVPAPSPVWVVGDARRVRLSALQLIARLPRCEVFTGPVDADSPLWFRFSGGRGAVAMDKRLEGCGVSGRLFQPVVDQLSGELKYCRPSRPALRLVNPASNWPPADLSET